MRTFPEIMIFLPIAIFAHYTIKHGYTMAELRALPKDKDGYIIAPIIKGK